MKKVYLRLLIFSLLIFTACKTHSDKEVKSNENNSNDVLVDELHLPAKVSRVLGLCPSSTEILASICPEKLVGRTQNCNFPPSIETLPIVNNYPLDIEGVMKLRPDLVLTLEGITPMDDIKRIEALGIPVYIQNFKTVDEVFEGIRDVGKICGAKVKADLLVDSLTHIKDSLLSQSFGEKLSAINIIWNAPIYVHGYYSIMTDKLRIAGMNNIIDSSFKKTSPEVSREYLLSKNPDVMFCAFSDYEKDFFNLYPELRRMKCYRNKAIFKITEDLQSRPGPRILEAVMELKNISKNAR
ncbi:ABC transporter substrate-binding protein [Sporocytophaga myxococcoides]|uniref:ABC transporter substrate-binding protein n=1 Tax=Sporocytophaga myxococcoides TaxID=153721 RepID=UPI0004904004|nr:helical backbone metal receptor [Sporocytophaga myxococcoides]